MSSDMRMSIDRDKDDILRWLNHHPTATVKDLYSVYGNYDIFNNGEEMKVAFEELGIKETERLGDTIVFVVEHVDGYKSVLTFTEDELLKALRRRIRP